YIASVQAERRRRRVRGRDARGNATALAAEMQELPAGTSHWIALKWLQRCAARNVTSSRIGTLSNVAASERHSGLMLAARITLAHFSVSSAMSFPKSAGEPASAVPPRSARRAFRLGSARPRLTSLLSLSTISAGAFLGASKPKKPLDS